MAFGKKKLAGAPKKIEEIMHFVDTLGVGDVLLVLCLGQHDVLADQLDRTGRAVSRLTWAGRKVQCVFARDGIVRPH